MIDRIARLEARVSELEKAVGTANVEDREVSAVAEVLGLFSAQRPASVSRAVELACSWGYQDRLPSLLSASDKGKQSSLGSLLRKLADHSTAIGTIRCRRDRRSKRYVYWLERHHPTTSISE